MMICRQIADLEIKRYYSLELLTPCKIHGRQRGSARSCRQFQETMVKKLTKSLLEGHLLVHVSSADFRLEGAKHEIAGRQ